MSCLSHHAPGEAPLGANSSECCVQVMVEAYRRDATSKDQLISELKTTKKRLDSEMKELRQELIRLQGEKRTVEVEHSRLQKEVSLTHQQMAELQEHLQSAQKERDEMEMHLQVCVKCVWSFLCAGSSWWLWLISGWSSCITLYVTMRLTT